jgi:hypothetical protein
MTEPVHRRFKGKTAPPPVTACRWAERSQAEPSGWLRRTNYRSGPTR